MNIELEIIQHRKENIGDTLLHIGLDNDFFFIFDTKKYINKGKNKQMGLLETSEFVYSKENSQQNEKSAYRIGQSVPKP